MAYFSCYCLPVVALLCALTTVYHKCYGDPMAATTAATTAAAVCEAAAVLREN